jgi:hypothetical protein
VAVLVFWVVTQWGLLVIYHCFEDNHVGGIMVSVLTIGPKVHGFKAGDDGFLRVLKINSTALFGGEVKPGPNVVRFYSM